MAPVRERVRKYREKLTEKQKNAAKEKDRIRKQNSRLQMSNNQKKEASKRSAERVKKYRMLKRSSLTNVSNSPTKAYQSPQACGKAISKVKKCLPRSPKKKVAIITKLVNDNGIQSLKRKPTHANALNENTKTAVVNFYQRDDISRQAPGRKDTVITRVDGKKIKLQKRHLYTVLTEVYELFKSENPTIQIGFSSFASLRPQHVLLSSDTPPNVYVCSYHANFECLVCSIGKIVPNFPSKSKELIEKLVCNRENEECMLRTCESCKENFDILASNIQNGSEKISWYTWENVEGRMLKIAKEGTLDEAANNLEGKIPSFLKHCFIK